MKGICERVWDAKEQDTLQAWILISDRRWIHRCHFWTKFFDFGSWLFTDVDFCHFSYRLAYSNIGMANGFTSPLFLDLFKFRSRLLRIYYFSQWYIVYTVTEPIQNEKSTEKNSGKTSCLRIWHFDGKNPPKQKSKTFVKRLWIANRNLGFWEKKSMRYKQKNIKKSVFCSHLEGQWRK
jgi:hypothetical protein